MFATAGTELVEAAPRDCLWGIGLSANNPKAKTKATWRGKNQLGHILTQVRDELMKRETSENEKKESKSDAPAAAGSE